MVVEMASYTVHCAYMSEVCYTRCINAVLLLRLWAYVALYVLCAALQDSAGEMYFYYSLFLTTACTMSAFVLHLCRYMHMVQIKQRHTHSSVSSLLQEKKKVTSVRNKPHLSRQCFGTFKVCIGVTIWQDSNNFNNSRLHITTLFVDMQLGTCSFKCGRL